MALWPFLLLKEESAERVEPIRRKRLCEDVRGLRRPVDVHELDLLVVDELTQEPNAGGDVLEAFAARSRLGEKDSRAVVAEDVARLIGLGNAEEGPWHARVGYPARPGTASTRS